MATRKKGIAMCFLLCLTRSLYDPAQLASSSITTFLQRGTIIPRLYLHMWNTTNDIKFCFYHDNNINVHHEAMKSIHNKLKQKPVYMQHLNINILQNRIWFTVKCKTILSSRWHNSSDAQYTQQGWNIICHSVGFTAFEIHITKELIIATMTGLELRTFTKDVESNYKIEN